MTVVGEEKGDCGNSAARVTRADYRTFVNRSAAACHPNGSHEPQLKAVY
jgi:hypothetical protein